MKTSKLILITFVITVLIIGLFDFIVAPKLPNTVQVGYFKAATNSEQILAVGVTKDSEAFAALYTKEGDKKWHQVLTDRCIIAKNGLGRKLEDDGKTPKGLFKITQAFGLAKDPGAMMKYTQIDNTYYWVGDTQSPLYNTLVSTKKVDYFDQPRSINFTSSKGAFEYAFSFNYNPYNIPNMGAGAFIQCMQSLDQKYTNGNIAFDHKTMVNLLKLVQDNCVIIIDDIGNLTNY